MSTLAKEAVAASTRNTQRVRNDKKMQDYARSANGRLSSIQAFIK
jgi:hypothetical protein